MLNVYSCFLKLYGPQTFQVCQDPHNFLILVSISYVLFVQPYQCMLCVCYSQFIILMYDALFVIDIISYKLQKYFEMPVNIHRS